MMTLDEFHKERPERRGSPETDFGSDWVEHPGYTFPRWRVSYVFATGDVYAVCLGGARIRQVKLLGVIPPDIVTDPARDTYWRTVERILSGRDLPAPSLWWAERQINLWLSDQWSHARTATS